MTYWQRFMGIARVEPIKPATASWTAACPQCLRDADWHSEATINATRYTIACRVCGTESWTPTAGERP